LAFGKSWSLQKDVIRSKKISQIWHPIFRHPDDQPISLTKSASNQTTTLRAHLDQLKDEFRRWPVKSGACGKSVNDATSSAYHNWQRSSLGSIKVTDIDLVRLSAEGEPIEAIELKRSFSPLQEWNPYSADYVNFNLLLAVCSRSAMRMTIAYNVRQTKPVFNDNASRLALFSYAAINSPARIGQFSYSDFLTGIY
jgi:hypothetical protein